MTRLGRAGRQAGHHINKRACGQQCSQRERTSRTTMPPWPLPQRSCQHRQLSLSSLGFAALRASCSGATRGLQENSLSGGSTYRPRQSTSQQNVSAFNLGKQECTLPCQTSVALPGVDLCCTTELVSCNFCRRHTQRVALLRALCFLSFPQTLKPGGWVPVDVSAVCVAHS